MTALTRLESQPAREHLIPTAGCLKNTYEQLLLSTDETQRRALAETFLTEQLELAAGLPEEMPQDLSALQDFVEQHCVEVAHQYADYLQQRKAGGPRKFFSNKAHALFFLQAVGPTKLVDGAELLIPMAGFIDKDAEIARLSKEMGKLDAEIASIEGKVANEGVVARAPEAVVAKERERLAACKEGKVKLQEQQATIAAL